MTVRPASPSSPAAISGESTPFVSSGTAPAEETFKPRSRSNSAVSAVLDFLCEEVSLHTPQDFVSPESRRDFSGPTDTLPVESTEPPQRPEPSPSLAATGVDVRPPNQDMPQAAFLSSSDRAALYQLLGAVSPTYIVNMEEYLQAPTQADKAIRANLPITEGLRSAQTFFQVTRESARVSAVNEADREFTHLLEVYSGKKRLSPQDQVKKNALTGLRDRYIVEQSDLILQSRLQNPSGGFNLIKRELLPILRQAMRDICESLESNNEPESAQYLKRAFNKIDKILNSNESKKIQSLVSNKLIFQFNEDLNNLESAASLPQIGVLPVYISRPKKQEPLSRLENLPQRLENNIVWLANTIAGIHHKLVDSNTSELKTLKVREFEPLQERILSISKNLKLVVNDITETLAKLHPDIGNPFQLNSEKINAEIEKISKLNLNSSEAYGSPMHSHVSAVALTSLFMINAEAMKIVGSVANVFNSQPEPDWEKLKEKSVKEASEQQGASSTLTSSALVADPSTEEADNAQLSIADLDYIPSNSDDIQEAENESESTILSSRPHEVVVQKSGAVREASATQRANNATPIDSLTFSRIDLKFVAQHLEAMSQKGLFAGTGVLSDIGQQLLGNKFIGRLNDQERERLLNSILPHLNRCTQDGKAITFETLLGFLRAASRCENNYLRKEFSSAAATNIIYNKNIDFGEKAHFNKFILDGGGIELIQQMRSLSFADARELTAKLLPFYNNAAQSQTFSETFRNTLKERMAYVSNVSPDTVINASLARALTAIAPRVIARPNNMARILALHVAKIHGKPLPLEVRQSTDPRVWEQAAIDVFKGECKHDPFTVHKRNGKQRVEINAHDAGIGVLKNVLAECMAVNPATRKPDYEKIDVTVGRSIRSDSEHTLRSVINKAIENTGWKAQAKDGISWELTYTRS